MKLLTLLAIMTGGFIAFSKTNSNWQLSDRYEKKPGSEIMRSVIEFRNGSAVSTYKPSEGPWGLVVKERKLINDVEYFITGWAQGARTVLFRVFAPSTDGVSTLCEETSFAESADIKIKEGVLQIQILNPSSEEVWKDCKVLK